MTSVTETTAATTERPTLFLRNATGLVKGWSGFDAFVYSFMSVNLVTLGMFYSLAIFAYVPDGSAMGSILISAVAVTFLAITYAGLIAVMPRAGGDYVWQSRVLDGIPGIVAGAVVGGAAGFLVGHATGMGDAGAIVLGLVGLAVGGAVGHRRGGIAFGLAGTGGGGLRAPARWERLRAGRDGLVVHPRPVGADLRRHPQDRVLPAAGGARGL